MKKLLLTFLCTGLLFGAKYETYSKYQEFSAEKAKIQGYSKILLTTEDKNELSKLIDKRTYLDNLDKYFSSSVTDIKLKRYMKTLSNPLVLRVNKIIDSEFSYKEHSDKYFTYLKSFKTEMPTKHRLELARDIVLESSDVFLFMKVIRENIPSDLLSEKSTFQKNNYFEKIKKKALKYYILRTLFVTKDFSDKEMIKYLTFLQSSKYKKIKEFKTEYTLAGFTVLEENDSAVSNVNEKELISEDEIKKTNQKIIDENIAENEALKKLVNNPSKNKKGKNSVMSKKQIKEFKNKQKEMEYSKKIKEAQIKAKEEGFNPLTFDPLSVE